MRARRWATPGALLLSVALHAVALGIGGWAVVRSLDARSLEASAPLAVEVTYGGGLDLPGMALGGAASRPDPLAPRPEPRAPGGGEHEPAPELDRGGRGGDERGERAMNLASSVDGLTLDRDPMNRLDRSQVQRLDTSAERRSPDDRRATPTPMELSFLATGDGATRERRPFAPRDPSSGVEVAGEAASVGGQVGGALVEDGVGPEPPPGSERTGADRDQPGLGVTGAASGPDFRRSARVMLARPLVAAGRAAVPAERKGRAQDRQDSSQEVAGAVAALLHASALGGRGGDGRGGARGAGAGQAGETGEGSRSSANGLGAGPRRGSADDARYTDWFRRIRAAVLAHWGDDMPREDALAGRGALAIVGFTVHPDGRVSGISVVRASGIPAFDRGAMAAIARAAPLAAVPRALGRGPVRLHFEFDAPNPVIAR
ncbi:MAG: TonB family protein [Polyangiaceae bacterium]|nr:TonB family protein [Polyangiaceae bacterium]